MNIVVLGRFTFPVPTKPNKAQIRALLKLVDQAVAAVNLAPVFNRADPIRVAPGVSVLGDPPGNQRGRKWRRSFKRDWKEEAYRQAIAELEAERDKARFDAKEFSDIACERSKECADYIEVVAELRKQLALVQEERNWAVTDLTEARAREKELETHRGAVGLALRQHARVKEAEARITELEAERDFLRQQNSTLALDAAINPQLVKLAQAAGITSEADVIALHDVHQELVSERDRLKAENDLLIDAFILKTGDEEFRAITEINWDSSEVRGDLCSSRDSAVESVLNAWVYESEEEDREPHISEVSDGH